jgi:hypothetical protein
MNYIFNVLARVLNRNLTQKQNVHKQYYFLGYNAMQSTQRKFSPLYSGLKNKPSETVPFVTTNVTTSNHAQKSVQVP